MDKNYSMFILRLSPREDIFSTAMHYYGRLYCISNDNYLVKKRQITKDNFYKLDYAQFVNGITMQHKLTFEECRQTDKEKDMAMYTLLYENWGTVYVEYFWEIKDAIRATLNYMEKNKLPFDLLTVDGREVGFGPAKSTVLSKFVEKMIKGEYAT